MKEISKIIVKINGLEKAIEKLDKDIIMKAIYPLEYDRLKVLFITQLRLLKWVLK